VVRAGLNVLFSSRYSNEDLTVALCERRNGPNLYLASAYLPYEGNEPPQQNVRALIKHAQNNGNDVILGCDANAHHTLWGRNDINKRGESLLEFVLFTSLATNSDSLMIDNLHVSTECSFSNHYRKVFEIRRDRKDKPPFRNTRRTDWIKFSRYVRESLQDHPVGKLIHPDSLERLTQTKNDSWAAFCEDLTSITEASRLRRLLAKDPAKPGLLCDLNGNFAKDSQESLQLLMNTHFPRVLEC